MEHTKSREKLSRLLETENSQLQKLNELVIRSISEEQLLANKLYQEETGATSYGDLVADRVASFGGSWIFIFSFLGFMLVWMGINLYLLTRPFDPFPFILLNLLLSTIAALQAPLIMMSQNRKEAKDRKRSENDYLVNLKSEIEIRNLHQKLDLLITEQMRTLFELQQVQVELMEDINQQVNRLRQGQS